MYTFIVCIQTNEELHLSWRCMLNGTTQTQPFSTEGLISPAMGNGAGKQPSAQSLALGFPHLNKNTSCETLVVGLPHSGTDQDGQPPFPNSEQWSAILAPELPISLLDP